MADFPVKWYTLGMQGAPTIDFYNPGELIALLDAVLVNGFGETALDSLTYDAGTSEGIAEITAGHDFMVDQVIEIAGADQAEYNGQWRVASVTGTLIRFVIDAVPASSGSGTMTIKTPPAGWTKAFVSGDGLRAIYKPNNDDRSGMYWYVDNTDNLAPASWWSTSGDGGSIRAAMIRGCESVTDIDTRTGEFGGGFIQRYYTTLSGATRYQDWAIIADDHTCFLQLNDDEGLNPEQNISYELLHTYCFGDLVSHRQPLIPDAFLVLDYATPRHEANNYLYNNSQSAPPNTNDQGDNGKTVSNGFGKNERHRHFFIASRAHDFHGLAQYNPAAHNGIALLDDKLMVEAASGSIVESNVFVGYMPAISLPLMGLQYTNREIITVAGKKQMALQYAISDGAPEYGAFFDIEGPWY